MTEKEKKRLAYSTSWMQEKKGVQRENCCFTLGLFVVLCLFCDIPAGGEFNEAFCTFRPSYV